jgi:hypothetical protein
VAQPVPYLPAELAVTPVDLQPVTLAVGARVDTRAGQRIVQHQRLLYLVLCVPYVVQLENSLRVAGKNLLAHNYCSCCFYKPVLIQVGLGCSQALCF